MHKIAYLVSEYPAISHIFIEREILALRKQGFEVHTYSVRQPPASSLISQTMRDEAAQTVVLQESKTKVLQAQSKTIRSGAVGYVKGLLGATKFGNRSVKAKIWQSFYFAEAAVLYRDLKDKGIHHIHAHFANNGADIARQTVELGKHIDGPQAPWSWSFTMHGPTEFDDVAGHDLAGKITDSSGVACISDYARSQMMRVSDPDQWHKLQCVVPMSVDVSHYRPRDAQEEPAPDGPLKVLTVGRLVPEKGFTILLDSAKLLVEAGVDFQWTVVGTGPYSERLAAQSRRLGLHNVVTFTGAIGQDELPAVYRAHDVYAMASFMEGLPVVIMEAMASGIPPVTTNVAAIPELVRHQQEGLLVDPARPDQLAMAIHRLADDKALRQQLGAAARERVVSRHSTDVAGAAQAEFFRSILEY